MMLATMALASHGNKRLQVHGTLFRQIHFLTDTKSRYAVIELEMLAV